MSYVHSDGGRSSSGPRGGYGDCGVRALAIAARLTYDHACELLREEQGVCPTNGTERKAMMAVMAQLGWEWTPTMRIGSGCTVHLRKDELPSGRLVVSLSKHYCAVIDGIPHDNHDPSRDGTRCVYGYWKEPTS